MPEAASKGSQASKLNIDMGQVLDLANLGVRRAAAFMALGLLNRQEPAPASLSLSDSIIRILPDPLDNASAKNIRKEFSAWIVGSGLRELETFFSMFLDRIFAVFQVCAQHDLHHNAGIQKTIHRFEKAGLIEKLKVLRKDLGIQAKVEQHILSIAQARNALTHAAGLVGQRHCNECDPLALRITWEGMQIEFIGVSSGLAEIVQDGKGMKPFNVADPAGASANLRLLMREQYVPIGSIIKLDPHDLHEICLMIQRAAADLCKQAEAKIRQLGNVQVIEAHDIQPSSAAGKSGRK